MSLAPHPDEEVRRALEILEASDDTAIERALQSTSASASGIITGLRSTLSFRHAVDSLGDALASLNTVVPPTVARAAQATENVWRGIADEFGLLSSTEVALLLGASNSNRTYAATLRKRGQLLGVERKNAFVYPGFQFDGDAARPHTWVAQLLALTARHGRSAGDATLWMVAPSTLFDGDRPVDHRDDTERIISVASRTWDVEW
ncbi:hypothetical protein ACL9RL_07820 [Plantibacter sp. Mn2098]|uniref:hypothetical protein n=1 Tax=Plantibacter sp. Mn2098 TaxID=3395266 RepID=UPI003BBB391B